MLDLTQDIDSLTNFKRNTPVFMEQLRQTGRPVVLTVNGKPELVVLDAASYQQMLELVDQLQTRAAIQQGLDEMKAGKGKPADEVFQKLRKKHRIPGEP